MANFHQNKNELSNFIYIITVCFFILISCQTKKNNILKAEDKKEDSFTEIINIPKDTIDFKNPNVSLTNGIYYLNDKKYSGIIYKEQKGFKVKTYSSVFNGKLNGIYRSFYANGNPFEIRSYKENVSVGNHFGYWKDSKKLKFSYNYQNNKKEGFQKSWYSNGNIAFIYNYKNDKQDGFQKAWRLNGSLYRNFQVKNGIRYGLQRSKSCYEVENEEIKIRTMATVIK
ncbi:hypothetical protein KO506_08385 [Polaribacter vadi]|uniref:toxin-antitoxin system YwqK family antitoxin n=1 Tax=Polaribacter TaxID=52959 RepID=UPI001C096CF9|nr:MULTISPECIES: hypothetical protein [Polaribacter]MBU3011417.1 hypothetical protein [Polaribacter vadi]MDO6741229.1 hypothetical protein [Polaribacter sp. 1_MG-2023]